MHENILECHHLHVGMEKNILLKNFTLCLGPGEIVGLHGPSGCGKSTLLRTIAGLLDPTKGKILLEGRSPEEYGWPLFRRKVTYVDQSPVMLNMSVENNLRRPFGYHVAGRKYPETKVPEIFTKIKLDLSLLNKNARKLSGGQMQRVSLVRALITDPSVLLLDEPTSSLDEESRQAVEDLLKKHVQDRGLSVIIVTHNIEQARKLGSRTVNLNTFLP
jgi:putative ABC transport system ATP-binding protein